ncbi:hypothetical protein [Kitasatospora kifunensis]|uniref:Uncharacterized protein n=1 Tax=Kitasatospora kifunensis TaxID=58351 RepID=A0A7W7QY57_KITKI|nr:hypothetical protein [Kitasatospora kifunensis]MBB4921948.1 hypothetical protein [Kitasatospora kifunensis]
MQWQFNVEENQASGLHITEAQLPEAKRKEAETALRELISAMGMIITFETARDGAGRTHPRGMVRRTSMGGDYYGLSEWTVGALGKIGWIATGEKLPDAHVYRSLRSPESGEHYDRSKYAKVASQWPVALGPLTTTVTAATDGHLPPCRSYPNAGPTRWTRGGAGRPAEGMVGNVGVGSGGPCRAPQPGDQRGQS